MTNVIQEPTSPEQKPHPFGVRLQSVRETMGMDRKDAAAHLRVHEKIIIMIESGIFNNDLPLAFIRGYIRSYSKLLEIPEPEVKAALDLIKPKLDVEEEAAQVAPVKTSSLSSANTIDSHNFFMTLFTALILVTLIGLVAIWWHSHKMTDSQIITLPVQNVSQSIDQAPAANLAASAVDAGIEGVTFPSAAAENRSNAANMDILPSQNTDLIASPPAADTTQIAETAPAAASKHEVIVKKTSFINLAAIKSSLAPYFNRGDKLTVKWAILGNHYLQLLVEFILFLFIINFGLRKYYHHSLIYVTGGSRPSIRTTPKPFRPLSANVQTTPKYHLARFFIFIFVLTGLVWYGFLHMKNSSIPAVPIVKITPPSETAMVRRPVAEDNLEQQIYANLENLAPPSNLNAKLLSTFKVYPLQSMVDQLNHYISEAQASKLVLTDPNTDIGQFTYKKKGRHRYKQPVVVHTYSENSDPYNDTETTN